MITPSAADSMPDIESALLCIPAERLEQSTMSELRDHLLHKTHKTKLLRIRCKLPPYVDPSPSITSNVTEESILDIESALMCIPEKPSGTRSGRGVRLETGSLNTLRIASRYVKEYSV